MWKKRLHTVVMFILLIFLMTPLHGAAETGVTLFTPYTGISVMPGETLSYSVEVSNDTSQVQQLRLSVDDLDESWQYHLTSGGFSINELSVYPGETERFTLEVEIPLQVEKGQYAFTVKAQSNAGLTTTLPLSVHITEEGIYQTNLSSDQLNMQGDSDSTFNYDLELSNKTAEEQLYSLQAEAPQGWQVEFRVDGQSVTSVSVESGETKSIRVNVTPAQNVTADLYQIPVVARAGQTESAVVLEADVIGTYDFQLTTEDARLSADIQAGKDRVLNLVVQNTGTVDLKGISLRSSAPPNWEVEFSVDQIDELKAGESQTVQATVTASSQALAGDYVLEISASTPEVAKSAQFRMSVKTSMLWGWIGVLIILAVAASLFFLIRKYGRR